MPPVNYNELIVQHTLVVIPDNALNGNDTSHYQSMAKTYEITKLLENMKFTLKCSECLVFKLFMMQTTNYCDI